MPQAGDPTDARPTAVWDMATGRKVSVFPQKDSPLNDAFFSRDGPLVVVVTGSYSKQADAYTTRGDVRNVENGKHLVTCELTRKGVGEKAGISPDQRTLVLASRHWISVFDLAGGCLRLDATEMRLSPISPVVFSPDGRLFAIGQGLDGSGEPGIVQVWETASGTIRHTFEGHQKQIPAIAFSPDGRLLASGSQDTTVIVWDVGPAARSA